MAESISMAWHGRRLSRETKVSLLDVVSDALGVIKLSQWSRAQGGLTPQRRVQIIRLSPTTVLYSRVGRFRSLSTNSLVASLACCPKRQQCS